MQRDDRGWVRRLRTWRRSVADLLLPRTCCGCGARLAGGEKLVCAQCRLTLPLEPNLNWEQNSKIAAWSQHKAVVRAGAFTRYSHGGIAAHIIHSLKYHRRVEVGEWMGRTAAQRLRDTGLFEGASAIVPLPLNARRLRQRGFNQAELIARGMAEELHLPVLTTLLCRPRDQESQTHFTYAERLHNAQGVFELADTALAKSMEGCTLILVDDVITTGTTMLSAIEALETINGIRLIAFAWSWVKKT